jgi:hypothetical protein
VKNIHLIFYPYLIKNFNVIILIYIYYRNFYLFIVDKQDALNNVGSSKQKSTSTASNSASSGDVASPSQRDASPTNSRMVPSSLAYTLGHMGAGSPAIAAAASQAIVATQQVTFLITKHCILYVHYS